MPSLRAEFVEKRGATSRRALVRLYDGADWVLSAVVGVTYSVPLPEDAVLAVLPAVAERHVVRKAEADPSWLESHRGGDEVEANITSYDLESVDALRALIE